MSLTATVNRGLNAIGEGSLYVLDNVGSYIAPSALGYFGGYVTGVGVQIGLLQGLSSAIYYRLVHIPFQKYVDQNTGSKDDEISPHAANFFKGIGVIASIIAPIIFTLHSASYVNRAAASLPQGNLIKSLFTSNPIHNYNLFTGLVVTFAPTLVQHWISFCRQANKGNQIQID